MIGIIIVDDQELIRDSLSYLLNDDQNIKVLGEAANGKEAISAIAKLKPDVVLLDIRMPEMDGLQVLDIVGERHPHTKIIVLTTFDEDEYIYESIKRGAHGYLLKNCSTQELINSIRDVMEEKASLNPNLTKKVFSLFSDMAKSNYRSINKSALPDSITKTELKIIKLIGMGYSNKEINFEMYMSEGTVRNYISSILKKLDLRDRTQVAIFAVQNGITMVRE